MIGFVVALESEAPNIFASLKDIKKDNVSGFNVCLFNILEEYCVLVYSGVGKVNAASATQMLIDHFKVNQIINVGSCGGVSKAVSVGDIILPNIVGYYDVDVTAFGYEINQIPHEPISFKTNESLNSKIESLLSGYPNRLVKGTVASGENFITTDNIKHFHISNNINAVDMEGCAIAQVCNKNDVKFTLIKIISDSIYKITASVEQWSNNMPSIGITVNKIITDVAYKLIYEKQKISH